MWTSTALKSEQRAWSGRVWRLVEAQHLVSTSRLADDAAEQALLEQLADAVKPRLPASAQGLDYLLAAPFRYGHARASRFRRADERPGIFYASEQERTALAETAYWRLRFFRRSPGLAPPLGTTIYSSFSVRVAAHRALDLTQPPFAADEARWTDPDDYGHCQALAAAARGVETDLIRTLSARDRRRRCNIVILDPAVFAHRHPRIGRSWHLRIDGDRLIALAAFPDGERHEFLAAALRL